MSESGSVEHESHSGEQQATAGISEQVDALKGFFAEKGLAGGRSVVTDEGGDEESGASSGWSQAPSFDSAVSEVESRWTSHGGEAPEHAPVTVDGTDATGDTGASDRRSAEGGGKPFIAPDGEEIDESGGSSDGSGSGQDAGSMS